MKKVLFFIPTLSGGGAEKVLVNLVNNMDFKKFDITVQTLFDVGANKMYLNDNIKYKYVFKKIFRGNVVLFKLFKPQFLYKNMIKDKYDIVISYLQSPTVRIVTGCDEKNTKLICWIHNEFHNIKKLSYMYRSEKEFRESMERYNKIVFVAESARVALTNVLPEITEKSCVMYNTVETDMIREKANETLEMDFSKNKIQLISVGRFAKQKGFERLINITARLKKDGFPIHLLILGDGELRSSYETMIKNLGLQDDVSLPGYQDNPYKYLKNADLFVCSSLHEGFSTAVTEALIVGTPVITTRCSGMEEMLGSNGEYGIITENSEDMLYEGIKGVIQNKKMLAELRDKAELRGNFFNTESTVKDVEKLLMEV